MTDYEPPRAMRVAGTVFASALGALLIAGIATTAWIGIRGVMAYGHLADAQAEAARVAENLDDPAGIAASVDLIARDTASARALTSDIVWRAAETLPWVGPQLAAVSTVSAVVDDVAVTAARPLAEVASTVTIDALRPQGGAIDLEVFVQMSAAAEQGANGMAAAAASLDDIDLGPLLRPLRDPIVQVADVLAEARDATGALARATTLLPAMLGADGPRDYLLLFQNNAEWRSLGGIPGAVSVIHTDGGALSLSAQATATTFPRYDDSVLSLGDEIEGIYSQRPGRWMHNVTQVPDFSVSAALAREMWARQFQQQVDGVIAIDPVALSYLLVATGPVVLPTGESLTSDNAVQLLLNDVYQRYEIPAEQDAFFASAAAAVFTALSTGQADPAALVQGLAQAGDENRLLIWSAHEPDQALLEGTTIAGGLPQTDDVTARFGVFFNDGTGSKMDYYMTPEVNVAWENCVMTADGHAEGTATLTVTLRNDAPPEAATLPDYITGGGIFGTPPGSAETVTYLYLPEGFSLTASSVTGDIGFGGGFHDGRRVLSFTTSLAPGESATATVSALSPEPGAPALAAKVTPTLNTAVTGQLAASCPSA